MNKSVSLVRLINSKQTNLIVIVFSFLNILSFNITAQDIKYYKVENEPSKTLEIINDKEINLERLESLLFNLNPTIYLSDSEQRLHGNGAAVVLDSDVQSLNELYKSNQTFNQVEIIKLSLNSISDLNLKLNVDELSSFYRLQYIFVEFAFDVCGDQNDSCLPSRIKNLISGVDSNVIVLYKLSIPN
jgi:hypothetical protein